MKIGAVHCNPKISPHLQHNDRTNSTSPNIHKERSHLNECNKSAQEALREIDKLYNEAMEKQKGKKGKKTPKERSYHEFIYEINENTTIAILLYTKKRKNSELKQARLIFVFLLCFFA
ncbi:hypothetical protein [Campylobacter helveticus]|uniref:hypothetical protein n=1 Tax=Campylobacter helveticus TaxID=28898 RepID=UPI0022EA26E8|nr:hypothetical protein [Campylobacter helveticus]